MNKNDIVKNQNNTIPSETIPEEIIDRPGMESVCFLNNKIEDSDLEFIFRTVVANLTEEMQQKITGTVKKIPGTQCQKIILQIASRHWYMYLTNIEEYNKNSAHSLDTNQQMNFIFGQNSICVLQNIMGNETIELIRLEFDKYKKNQSEKLHEMLSLQFSQINKANAKQVETERVETERVETEQVETEQVETEQANTEQANAE